MASAPYSAHLLVVCHGLWGETKHIQYICDSAAKHAAEAQAAAGPTSLISDKVKLVVLPASLNQSVLTYDGIDISGERVVKEIDSEISRIAADGGTVERFSIVGYSLGGLVARYSIGILHSREPSFFSNVRPVNFATFASPAIGIPRYNTFWSTVIFFLGSRLLSRSGQQLYGADRFLPESLLDGTGTHIAAKTLLSRFRPKKEQAASLLTVLADPQYNFYRALESFEKVDIYANAIVDRTVPYPTGAIEAHDPFALAHAKAEQAMKAAGIDPGDQPIDYQQGGLLISLAATNPHLITSFSSCPPIAPPALTKPREHSAYKFKLPLLLRPTSYPFSRPVSLAIIFFLPVALPVMLAYAVGAFLLAGRRSRQRIKDVRAGLGTRVSMLERVGVRFNAVAQELALEGTSGIDMEREDEGLGLLNGKRHGVDRFSDYGGTGIETPPLARGTEPSKGVTEGADGSAEKPFPSDPVLTPEQLLMIARLNAIPQLKKHLTYFPRARNSHGVIVARDPNFPAHREGRLVVDAWAKDFRL